MSLADRTDIQGFADVLRNIRGMSESVTRVLKVVRVVRDALPTDRTAQEEIAGFMRDMGAIAFSLRELADTIDREAAKFMVS
jgi:hypothetical protein